MGSRSPAGKEESAPPLSGYALASGTAAGLAGSAARNAGNDGAGGNRPGSEDASGNAEPPATSPSSLPGSPSGPVLLSGTLASGATRDSGPALLPPRLPEKVGELAQAGGGQVSLEVHPPHLGPVGVRVRVDEKTRLVSVELSSHDSRIRHLLSEKEGSIKESLSRSGFVMDRFQVASAPAPSGTDPGLLLAGSGSEVRREGTGNGSSGTDGGLSSGSSGQGSDPFERQGGTGLLPQDEGRDPSPRNGPEGLEGRLPDPEASVDILRKAAALRHEPGYHRIA